MKDKDSKMLFEAYSKVYIKEEEDPSEYNSRYYDEERARRTYEDVEKEFEFKHPVKGKEYNFIATVDYELEDTGDDWEYHRFEVYKMAYEDPNTGEYVDVDPDTKTTLTDFRGRTQEMTLAEVAKYHIEGNGLDNFVGL
jgi:hypothetical protein